MSGGIGRQSLSSVHCLTVVVVVVVDVATPSAGAGYSTSRSRGEVINNAYGCFPEYVICTFLGCTHLRIRNGSCEQGGRGRGSEGERRIRVLCQCARICARRHLTGSGGGSRCVGGAKGSGGDSQRRSPVRHRV